MYIFIVTYRQRPRQGEAQHTAQFGLHLKNVHFIQKLCTEEHNQTTTTQESNNTTPHNNTQTQ